MLLLQRSKEVLLYTSSEHFSRQNLYTRQHVCIYTRGCELGQHSNFDVRFHGRVFAGSARCTIFSAKMAQNLAKTLSNLYYNLDSSTAFSSVYPLYKAAKKIHKNVTISQVKKWYLGQRTATLWHRSSGNLARNPTVQVRFMHQIQADLLDMQRFAGANDGHRYILGVIDVFSRRAFVKKLRRKTAAEVSDAVRTILDQIPSAKVFQTDLGKEFLGASLKTYLKNRGISVWLSQDRDVKCTIIERFFRTLREKIMKIFTANGGDQKWVPYLPKIVKNYNNSKHRSIGMSPNQVNSQNFHLIRRKLYPQKLKAKKRVLLPVGTLVRLNRKKSKFEKNTWQNTAEVFRISKAINRSPNAIYKTVKLFWAVFTVKISSRYTSKKRPDNSRSVSTPSRVPSRRGSSVERPLRARSCSINKKCR